MARALDFLPKDPTEDAILEGFLAYTDALGITLYPAQEEAILEVAAGNNVILNTPTGSGKSHVAACAHFRALARGERSFYTCPIKALANEKFFALASELGPENVGLLTGDASVNEGAPIVCATAEVLANMALRQGRDAPVDHVVMDEFHYYADKDRGVAWQIPLLEMPQATFLLMSATLGDTTPFEGYLEKLNGRPTKVVKSATRPVPLTFTYSDIPVHEIVMELVGKGRAPIYLVNFTQRGAAEEAQSLMSIDVCSKEEKRSIAEALAGVRWQSPYAKEVQRYVRHGLGLHHAGLLPKYRLLVERLAQKGLLKVISGTDTLGVGVNIPIRTVLFTKLCKFDGEKTALLSVRDFQQIAGRAGRKGFDDEGFVVAQAPEHVIENLRLEAKAAGDPKKLKKLVRRKPPDRGYVPWDKATFEKLVGGTPETLVSRFQITHGTVLSILQRPGGGCMSLGRLVKRSHERPAQKRILGKTARDLVRSLVDAGIVETEEADGRRRVVVNADLQEDFSLHHALSLYLVETCERLDPDSPTYALDLLTLVESILENPDVILMRQLDFLKAAKVAELKAAGVEYEERMAELEKLEYPKPNRDFVYDTFNEFARRHPWVGAENIRPKSIARDMIEKYLSFSDYVKEYDLARSEGLLLRYLSEVYKVLAQTVPPSAKNDEVDDLSIFFGAMVRQVDSSLIDEWEKMRTGAPPGGAGERATEGGEPEGSRDVTIDERGFMVLVRNAVFEIVRALARRDYGGASERIADPEWPPSRVEAAMAPYFADHGAVRADPDARSPKLLALEKGDFTWDLRQTLIDADGETPFYLGGYVDLEASRVEGRAVLRIKHVGA